MTAHDGNASGLVLVGLGRIAQAHLDALVGRTDLPLVAGVEPNEQAAAAFRAKGLRVFPDLEALFAELTPLAAIVATPNQTHATLIGSLLTHGVHVLAEKPLALNVEEAEELVEKARRRGLVLQTASKFGVMPSLAQAVGLVRAGRIGTLRRIENVFTGVLDVRSDWRARPDLSGGGVWMDNGPHSLDVLTALGGYPERLRVTHQARAQGSPVEDEIDVELELGDGSPATISLSWNKAVKAPIARLVGDSGEIAVDWGALRLVTDGREEVLGGGYDKVGCFRAVHERFAEAIRMKAGTPDGAEEHGARVLSAIEAAYRSAACGGRWEKVRV